MTPEQSARLRALAEWAELEAAESDRCAAALTQIGDARALAKSIRAEDFRSLARLARAVAGAVVVSACCGELPESGGLRCSYCLLPFVAMVEIAALLRAVEGGE